MSVMLESERGGRTAADETQGASTGAGLATVDRRGGDSGTLARLEPADLAHADPATAMGIGAAERRRRGVFGWIGVGLVLLLKTVLPVAALAAAVFGARYLAAGKPALPPPAPQEARIPVETVAAVRQDIRPTIKTYGTTIAGRQVEMRSLVAGRVLQTGAALRDGAVVEAGGLLLKIDPFDYANQLEETRAQLAEAKAKLAELKASLRVDEADLAFARQQLALAQADLGRAERLAQRGNLAERALDERRLTVSQRRQSLTQSENSVQVKTARIAQQEAAIVRIETTIARNQKRVAETELKAPFTAYVTDVGAQVGRMLNANDRVATLIDRDWIEVSFTLTDRQYGRLQSDADFVGGDVKVIWEIGAKPAIYAAKVERVAARVTSSSGGVVVYARIADPTDGVPIRPGAFVRVEVSDVAYQGVIKVPSQAVYDGRVVYVVEDGRLAPRDISIAGVDGESVLIRGDLGDGARIVTTRLSAPGPGIAVEERARNGT